MMKSHIWIFLLISISSFIDATSNESTSAAVKFILSPSTLTRDDSTNSSGILIRKNISSPNMSFAFTITTPSTTIPNSSSKALEYFGNVHGRELRRYKDDLSKSKRSTMTEKSMAPECEPFTVGNMTAKTFFSPGYPDNYTKNISCVRVLEAPSGYLLRLDFRDHFNIEPSDECKFDYLEIRDGAHGFSTFLGQFCGHSFPEIITSKDRHLWLHFHSDENIEYNGFKAVYEFIPRPTSAVYDETECGGTVDEYEGFVNSTFVSKEKLDYVARHNLQLDCMWVIKVPDDWKIQLRFELFRLEKPNDCDSNFVDIFSENTDLPSRLKNYCGSIADSVQSKSNTLYIRYFAEAMAINSSFSILYTAFRDKKTSDEKCKDDEYDCDDSTCIKDYLKCNGRKNCRFQWDEDIEKCKTASSSHSEHIQIILGVFGFILTGLVIAFVVNCMRKIVRDHKIIREHIRQSRESKLDELGRHSTKMTKSREHIALSQLTKIPPPAFDLESPSSINLIENNTTNHHIYRDAMSHNNGARIIDSKNDLNLREQEIKNIMGSSYDADDLKDAEMCDMACQTRESLFQPVFKNKVTQSPCPKPNSGIRFSTFGYPTDYSTPSPPPPPAAASSISIGSPAQCPTHSQMTSKVMMPSQHSHQHHHHFHHIHSNSSSTNQSSGEGNDKGTSTNIRMDDYRTIDNDDKQKKFVVKKDETQARSFSDLRKSAPDVIIISGCTTQH